MIPFEIKNEGRNIQSWQGKSLRVHILHSSAGIAQQIWIEGEK